MTDIQGRIYAEWAGWRVVDHPRQGYAVLNPFGELRRQVIYGLPLRPPTPREADAAIWSTAIGYHADLKAADPARYAYWRMDDDYDERTLVEIANAQTPLSDSEPPASERSAKEQPINHARCCE